MSPAGSEWEVGSEGGASARETGRARKARREGVLGAGLGMGNGELWITRRNKGYRLKADGGKVMSFEC